MKRSTIIVFFLGLAIGLAIIFVVDMAGGNSTTKSKEYLVLKAELNKMKASDSTKTLQVAAYKKLNDDLMAGKNDDTLNGTKYNASPPSVTVSATKTNVMYRGLDNPIEVSVSGFEPNTLNVGCSGGTMSGGNGKFIVKPGSGKEINISVSAKTNDEEAISIGTYKFRVKSVPTPVVTWAGAKSGERVSASKASGSPLLPKVEDFDFDVYTVINSFSISIPSARISKDVVGNSIPSDVASKIKGLPKGAIVYFDNIKITVPGSDRRTASATYIIQ